MQSEDEEVVSEVRLSGSRTEESGWALWRLSYGHMVSPQESGRTPDDHDSCAVPENRAESDSDDGDAKDCDGDWRPRRRKKRKNSILNVRVKACSTAKLCGLQIWGAALILSDYILSKANELIGQVVVELGAGPAMPGLIAARICKKVFVTDFDDEVLLNCQYNIQKNGLADSCVPRKLDWADASMLNQSRRRGPRHVDRGTDHQPRKGVPESREEDAGRDDEDGNAQDAFCWTEQDANDLAEATTLFAADVIYSNQITDLFVRQIQALLSEKKGRELIMAVEKRTNFTLPELRSTSREYDHFFARIAAPLDASAGTSFISERIPVDFPQHFSHTHSEQLELWRISLSQDQNDISKWDTRAVEDMEDEA